MRCELTLQEIKNIEIEILTYIDKICRENNIRYFLAGGTLLGAVRHKGFIPWDDDIDINMMRSDYDKFVTIMSKNKHSRFVLKSAEVCKDYVYAYAKMVDVTTEIAEQENEYPGYGVFVDIFPLDGLPADERKRRRHQDKMNLYANMLGYSIIHNIQTNSIVNKIKHILSKLIGYRKIIKLLDGTARKYSDVCAPYVSNIVAAVKKYRYIDRKLFDDIAEVEFEGRYYMAPKDYDEYLKGLYGDYMKLPPIEQRVSNHSFVAYGKEG